MTLRSGRKVRPAWRLQLPPITSLDATFDTCDSTKTFIWCKFVLLAIIQSINRFQMSSSSVRNTLPSIAPSLPFIYPHWSSRLLKDGCCQGSLLPYNP